MKYLVVNIARITYLDNPRRNPDEQVPFLIMSLKDYYPFGMLMPGRTFSSDGYRFGFNGQENDDEIHGKGNHYEFKYRMHDSRLGRFLSVDPLTSKFAYNSPYAFAENRVIDGMELEGLEVVLVGKQEAANVIVGGSAEVGVIIAPDGVYAYGSTAVGLATTVSVSSSISLTFYPTMPEAQNASGWGWNAGVGFGEVVVGSVNLAQSSGFYGVNVTVGVGGGLAPIEGHAYASYTAIKPLSEDARMATMGILEQAKFGLQSKIESLTSDALKLSSENNVLSTENAILKRQLKGANGNLHNELTDKININNQKYWSNYKEINEKKADIKNLSAADQEIEGAINQLKSKDQK